MDGLNYAVALGASLRRATRLYLAHAIYAAAAALPGRYRGQHRVRRGHMSTIELAAHHARARAASQLALRRITEERSLVPPQLRRYLELEPIL
jgi:hypothetical protein